MKNRPRMKIMASCGPLLVIVVCALIALSSPESVRADEMIDPERYLVGPGDGFTIEFFDAQLLPIEFTISIEGVAAISNVGSFLVAGMTLSQAKAALRTGLQASYSGADFSIALSSVRKKWVSVAGAVGKPGLYDGAASTLASQLLNDAGGLLPGASRRNIILRNADGGVAVDLVRFLRLGDFGANPSLYLGDVLYVPLLSDSTTGLYVSGEVRQPGWIEFTGRDNLLDLVELAGGLAGSAREDSVIVFSGADGRTEGAMMALESDYLPGEGARIIVLPAETRSDQDDISVSGYAKYSGRFPFIEGMTLPDALARSGGVRDDAYQPGITVFNIRLDRSAAARTLDSLETMSLENSDFPLTGAPQGSAQLRVRETYDFHKNSLRDIPLRPGDSIFVPRAEGFVTFLGQVARPGLVSFADGLSSSDLIDRAGGLTAWADLSRSYVNRRVGGNSTPLSSAGRIYDGDIIYVARKVKKGGGFLGTLRDVSLLGAGIALSALAIDQLAK